MSVYKRFSDELYHARKLKGLTQAQVAESVNISVRWYQHVEKGDRKPGTRLTLNLIAYLEIDGKCLQDNAVKEVVIL